MDKDHKIFAITFYYLGEGEMAVSAEGSIEGNLIPTLIGHLAIIQKTLIDEAGRRNEGETVFVEKKPDAN